MNRLLILILTIAGLFVLWPFSIMVPLKLLVVFFHEASHALMTVATGGDVVELVINPRQGGHVLSAGGNRFLTLSAGYLGSLLWGALIYLAAVKSRYDKALMVVLGLVIVSICLLYIRDLFALAFCGLSAAAMFLAAAKGSTRLNDAILQVIGLTSMLYAPLDIYSDTIVRASLRSDAVMLAEEFGGHGIAWGGAWLLISVVILVATFVVGLRTAPTRRRQASRSGGPSWFKE